MKYLVFSVYQSFTMRSRILVLFILFSTGAYAQCKSFKIGVFGDTLNCIDMQGLKQGKWTIRVNPLRGNPGYEEEGIFRNDLKEGPWKQFNLMGDKVADENYKGGNKSGRCYYFSLSGVLIREESWRPPSDASRMFDTVLVQDPKRLNNYEQVIVKTDGKSVRHGIWKYYDDQFGNMINQETYILDVLKTDAPDLLKKVAVKKVTDTTTATNTIAVPKPVATPKFGQKSTKKKSNVQ